GRLILDAARARQVPIDAVESFTAHPGAGVSATTAGRKLLVGTRRLLEGQGLEVSPEARALLGRLGAAGQRGRPGARAGGGRGAGVVLGAVGARDRIRPEAPGVLADLRDLGIRDFALLTGDRSAAANRVSAELGIERVHAELLPAQKAEIVASFGARSVSEG